MEQILAEENCEVDQKCYNCHTGKSDVRCSDCFNALLCIDCDAKMHHNTFFHDRELKRNNFWRNVAPNIVLDHERNIIERGIDIFKNIFENDGII